MTIPTLRRDLRLMALALAICLSTAVAVEQMDVAAASAPTLWWDGAEAKDQAVEAGSKGHRRAELVNPTPMTDEQYRAVLVACGTYDIPVPLALGVMEVESGFRADAVGVDGRDYGLFQLRDSNHTWLVEVTGADPKTPTGNITCGVYMLSYLLSRYEATDTALAAYRWGYDNGDRGYANKVLRAADRWKEVLPE